MRFSVLLGFLIALTVLSASIQSSDPLADVTISTSTELDRTKQSAPVGPNLIKLLASLSDIALLAVIAMCFRTLCLDEHRLIHHYLYLATFFFLIESFGSLSHGWHTINYPVIRQFHPSIPPIPDYRTAAGQTVLLMWIIKALSMTTILNGEFRDGPSLCDTSDRTLFNNLPYALGIFGATILSAVMTIPVFI